MSDGPSFKQLALRHLPVLVIALAMTILGAAVLSSQRWLRGHLRHQLALRDGQAFAALLQGHWAAKESEPSNWQSDRPADQLAAVIEASQMIAAKGFLGVRLFDASGALSAAIPANLADTQISGQDWKSLRILEPVSRYTEQARLEDLFLGSSPQNKRAFAPILEVSAPLSSSEKSDFMGVAQLVLDGENLARQYAALDRQLWNQSAFVLLICGALLSGLVGVSFHWLKKSHAELAARTGLLMESERHNCRAAKLTAVGAVAGNMIISMQKSVAELEACLTNAYAPVEQGVVCSRAAKYLRKMRLTLVGARRTFERFHDKSSYKVALADFVELTAIKNVPSLREQGIELDTRIDGDALLIATHAELAGLIFGNFIEMAAETCEAGKDHLELALQVHESGVAIEVLGWRSRNRFLSGASSDIDASIVPSPADCRMAISEDLAREMGARIEVRCAAEDRSAFILSMPWRRGILQNAKVDSKADELVSGTFAAA
ncbi:MAG: hypothetical protein EXS31_01560 [Pedosphaera sp.]|nr:hypothetical protein [Pedosphaera sp.]